MDQPEAVEVEQEVDNNGRPRQPEPPPVQELSMDEVTLTVLDHVHSNSSYLGIVLATLRVL